MGTLPIDFLIPDEEPLDPPEVPVERDPHSYPGAHLVYGPRRSSSAVSIDSYGEFTARTESAMPTSQERVNATICIGSNGVRPCTIIGDTID